MRLLVALFALAMMTISLGCAPEETATTEAPATTTPAASADATPAAAAAVTADTSAMQEVSLKLPGMT